MRSHKSNQQTIQKHFVLTIGRSGSNFLVNTLNKHPNVVNYGEVLGDWTLPYKLYKVLSIFNLNIKNYLDCFFYSKLFFYAGQLVSAASHAKNNQKIQFKLYSNIRSIGIKDFSFLLKDRDVIDYFTQANDLKIIHLYRKNILKRYISLAQMSQTGIIKTDSIVEHKTIELDIPDMLQKLETFSNELQLSFSIANKIPSERIFSLSYEDYFRSHEDTLHFNKEIFKFLGVHPITVASNQKKIGKDDLKTYIRNYDDVVTALKDTKYEKYLDS